MTSPTTTTTPSSAATDYDAGAKKALELTYSEALRLGHNYIETAHILLALIELDIICAEPSPE